MSTALSELRNLLQRLRQPQGCAWTRQQNFASLAPQTIEECYELLEAIEQGDVTKIRDELGDLLYHIFFYAQVAEENNLFNIDDVAQSMLDKHEERMPDDLQLQNLDAEETNRHWQKIKEKKRKEAGYESILDGIASTLPATSYANKLQERAADVGFDWPNVEPVFEKVNEEILELKSEIENKSSQEEIKAEYGDLLFACINLGRHLDLSPESALRLSNRKFMHRFKYIEQQLEKSGKKFSDVSLEELEELWEESKKKRHPGN